MNRVVISGRIATDLELKQVGDDKVDVCSFKLAVKRPRVKDITDFIQVVAWRQEARFITQYFQKGDSIELEGCLSVREFEDRNGDKKRIDEVIVDGAYFSYGKKRTEEKTELPF